MIKPKLWLLNFLVLLLAHLAWSPLQAQDSPLTVDPGISKLASHLCLRLQEEHVSKILFADLKGPNGEAHPIGRWLADQFALSCNHDFPSIGVILRPADERDLPAADGSDFKKDPPKSVEDWARRMGANVVVRGTFGRFPEGLGISLSAVAAMDSPSPLSEASGMVPISTAMSAVSAEPIPTPKENTPRAGVAGVTVPQCIYCPAPEYTKEARKEHIEGTVVLQVTINPDGRATNISIVKDPGKGLGDRAVETLRKWRFRPATDPNGKNIPALVPIAVSFRLYN